MNVEFSQSKPQQTGTGLLIRHGEVATTSDCTKFCSGCSTTKSLSEFNRKGTKSDGSVKYQSWCKNCNKLRSKKYYADNRDEHKRVIVKRNQDVRRVCIQFIVSYLKTHPCVDCGESDPVVLDFDHVRGNKVGTVTRLAKSSLKAVEAEIEKCEVVCANCHRRRTAKRDGNWAKSK